MVPGSARIAILREVPGECISCTIDDANSSVGGVAIDKTHTRVCAAPGTVLGLHTAQFGSGERKDLF